ncbi:MAG: hypothetical protein QM790_18585 [Nibricoccus sp.]
MKKNYRYDVESAAKNTQGGTLMKLLVFLVVFGCVVVAGWIYFLPVVLTSSLQKHTGFGVKVAQLGFNPFTARVDLAGLVLTNPESYPRKDFIEVTSFQANAKAASLFGSRPEFDYARVEVAYVAIVRDADGVVNMQLFNDRLNPPAKGPEEKKKLAVELEPARDPSVSQGGLAKPAVDKKPDPKEPKKVTEPAGKGKKGDAAKDAKPAQKPMQFLIHRLELRLEKVIVADYTGPLPTVKEYNCKLFYAFNEVTDPKQLMAPFALKSLQTVGAAIRGLIPGDIGKAVGAATENADPMLKPKDTPEQDPLKTVVEKLEETQKP